jgi:hypothetical protein
MKYLSILALGLSSLALIVAITSRPKLMSPMSKEELEKITKVLLEAFHYALRRPTVVSVKAYAVE